MPGPVSDAYDPEWGTASNGDEIKDAIQGVYNKLSVILRNRPPLFILDLVCSDELNREIDARLTEKEWRILRFCCERAADSI